MANVGQRSTQNSHFTSNGGDQLVTSPQSRAHRTAVVLGVLEHLLQLVEESLNVLPAFAQRHEKIGGDGQEGLIEVTDNQHPGLGAF
jgi:hypothetical protein